MNHCAQLVRYIRATKHPGGNAAGQIASNMQLEREAVATGFEGMAARFLAFEESPIVLANEVRRTRRSEGQPRGRMRYSTPQKECFGGLTNRCSEGA